MYLPGGDVGKTWSSLMLVKGWYWKPSGCRDHGFGHAGQAEFNADFNANFNADGMLQGVPTPKVQRQWEAVSTPMGGLQIPTPKGACHITA